MNTQIGTVTVEQSFRLSRPQESASAYYDIQVEPGTYAIETRDSRYGGKYLAVVFTGIVLASGYAGDSKVRYRDEEGKLGEVVFQPYKYQLESGKFWGKVELTDPKALESIKGV